ncbi:ABC transporter substrate-binding protein [Streptomyces litchfieldiae]|uniref:ABC transporter substrate-binding protein n=1 Tax=Streptomyces litchfieldiae TaxID=3075543 RepID=A0ABU2MV78_9ACTN|nr:ABC transporter substrate-binding protein [Streptomyces sp. DSM 44938]MDT0345551.1 ABC transporter substrate-binding protein [Streptomyces sp. DSM 44938]
MTSSRIPFLSRRALLSASGAVGAGVLLTACGDDSSGDGSGNSGSGGGNAAADSFSFTDDRGETVELDAVPERIVAFVGTAAALHDYGVASVGVFGPTTLPNGEPDVQAGSLDVDSLTVLGNAWGEFNVEEYAQLEPQLLVTNMFEPGALWYVPEESTEDITAFAPSVGILVAPTADNPDVRLQGIIERYTELAEALGADLSATAVTEAKSRYEAAAESLRQAARDNPGIKVLACSGAADLFYASDPASSADLAYFKDLGVELITPDNLDDGGFFESLSWENADKYPADVLLLDSRSVALQPDALADKPTWTRLPAVEAGQITGWNSEPIYSYAGCAPLLEALAEAIRNARKVS